MEAATACASIVEVRSWIVDCEGDDGGIGTSRIVGPHGVVGRCSHRIWRTPNTTVAGSKGETRGQGGVDGPGCHFATNVDRVERADGRILGVGIGGRRIGNVWCIQPDFKPNLSAERLARDVGPYCVGRIGGGCGRCARDGTGASGQAETSWK